jgi:hypothetical protein
MTDQAKDVEQAGTKEKRNITVSREYSLPLPRSEQAYMIPASEWGRLKRMISKIAPPRNWFQAGGWLFLGIAITSFLPMLGAGDFSFHRNIVPWAAIVCFGVLAAALFYLDTQQRQDITQSSKTVIDEMLALEGMYAAPADPDPTVEIDTPK